MPVVVDTSAWIEFLLGSPTGVKVRGRLPEVGDWVVPTMVQLELQKWCLRERDAQFAGRVIAFSNTCRVVWLDPRIAVMSAEVWREAKLSTADAVIYATARAHGATLLTCDRHFEGLEAAEVLGKP